MLTAYLAEKLTFARAGPMTRNTRFAMSIPMTLLYLQRSQFELLKNPYVLYDGAPQRSV